MPIEKRDHVSGAKLFIPTSSERATLQNARKLKQELDEVGKMKEELAKLIEEAKRAK